MQQGRKLCERKETVKGSVTTETAESEGRVNVRRRECKGKSKRKGDAPTKRNAKTTRLTSQELWQTFVHLYTQTPDWQLTVRHRLATVSAAPHFAIGVKVCFLSVCVGIL